MTAPRAAHDMVIVGGGLSGSRLLVELLDLLDDPTSGRPPTITMVDQLGEFGRGVPYGRPSRQGFLLIEPVAASTPPGFHAWLTANRRLLLGAAHSDDPVLSDWVRHNVDAIRAGHFADMYVPRSVFGRYSAQVLYGSVARAGRAGLADVRMMRSRVVDLEPGSGDWTVLLADGQRLRAGVVVLAVGSVPRRNDTGLTAADGYVHDLYPDGFDRLEAAFDEHARVLCRPLRLVIVGSNASAAELLHLLSHTPRLRDRLEVVDVFSGSGGLPGAPNVAGLRPSAREYVYSAEQLVNAGKLVVRRARVGDVIRFGPGLAVRCEGANRPWPADIVVNCTGSGRIGRTDAPLLVNLARRAPMFEADESRWGLRVDPDTGGVVNADGVFVVGPMLNRDSVETHVESIEAVYRTAARLAGPIHRRLTSAVGEPVDVAAGGSLDAHR